LNAFLMMSDPPSSLPLREKPQKVKDGNIQIRLGGLCYEVPKRPLECWFTDHNPIHTQLHVSGVPKFIAHLLVDYLKTGFSHEDTWLDTLPQEVFLDLQIWSENLRLHTLSQSLVKRIESMLSTNREEAVRNLHLLAGLEKQRKKRKRSLNSLKPKIKQEVQVKKETQ